MKVTQCQRILDYMDQFGSITWLEAARDLGVARLASRIKDLKNMGYSIESKTVSAKNRFGERTCFKAYRLAEEKE